MKPSLKTYPAATRIIELEARCVELEIEMEARIIELEARIAELEARNMELEAVIEAHRARITQASPADMALWKALEGE